MEWKKAWQIIFIYVNQCKKWHIPQPYTATDLTSFKRICEKYIHPKTIFKYLILEVAI